MKIIFAIVSVLLSVAGGTAAADVKYTPDGKFLNVAILTLPDRYLADIPIAKRSVLLLQLSSSSFENRRLDYNHGWLHWYSDGPPEDSPGATSMFWLKLLRQESGKWLVFVHMSKPFSAKNGDPEANQTFVLQRDGGKWKDVTSSVIPKEVDLTMHFRPRRSTNVIEVASWERFERQDGRGPAYRFGPRKLDLTWEDGAFRATDPESPKLTKDF